MSATPWKPQFPIADPALQRSLQSLSDTLLVPWKHVFRLTFSGTSSSASYAVVPSPSTSMTIRKLRDSTRLVFTIHASAYIAAGSGGVGAGLRLTNQASLVASDYLSSYQFFNSALDHQSFSGGNYADGLAAGLYTLTPLWAMSGGVTGTLNAEDVWTIQIEEINGAPDL